MKMCNTQNPNYRLMRTLFTLSFLFNFWAFGGFTDLIACNPDIEAPLAVCDADIYVDVAMGAVTLLADEVDEGSWDACTPTPLLDFRLELDAFSATPPATTSVTVDQMDIGEHFVSMWVLDQAGNYNTCWASIYVQDCTNNPPQSCISGLTITLQPGQSEFIYPSDLIANIPQCWASDVSLALELNNNPPVPYIEFTTAHTGTQTVTVEQYSNGQPLGISCAVTVEVISDCTNDVTPPLTACTGDYTVNLINGTFTLLPEHIDESSWDPCTPQDSLDFRLELNNFSSSPPATTSIVLDTDDVGMNFVTLWVIDQAGNWNTCWSEVFVEDCSNDTEPPVAICDIQINVELGVDGPNQTNVWATDVDDGSYDLCTTTPNMSYRIELGSVPSSTPPTTEFIEFTDAHLGLNDVILWVIDGAGNWNQCLSVVNILPSNCTNDIFPPSIIAPADVQMTSEDFLALGLDPITTAGLEANFGAFTAIDNCEIGGILPTFTVTNQNCNGQQVPLIIERTAVAYDQAGNFSAPATQVIELSPEYQVHVPGYFLPGDVFEDTLDFTEGPFTILAKTWADVYYDYDCDDQPDIIEREWSLVNWCNYDGEAATILPALDLDGDQEYGDPYDIIVLADSAYLFDNGQVGAAVAPRAEYYVYTQEIRYNYLDTVNLWLTGTVFLDNDQDCAFNAEPTLANWPVKIVGLVSGEVIYTQTDAVGQYVANLCANDTTVEVSLDLPYDYGQGCPTTYTVTYSSGNQLLTQDIAVQLDTDCPLLHVDIGAPFLRRCMENFYFVNYANLSDQTINGASVNVVLDDDMTFTSSSLPETPLGNNEYAFDIGDLAPGQAGQFTVFANLDCNVQLGATHCTEAYIFPDTLCPMLAGWSGANIEVEGFCENDSIFLRVVNTGTGDMDGPLEFIVVEDVIMIMQNDFDLNSNEDDLVLAMPSNGATWRLEAEQEPNHPYFGNIAVAVEGCGGINEVGLVNLFPLNNPNPFIAVDCQENIGSFDPNDKLAFPTGYGAANYIEATDRLEYKIRFQNTGTDTAFKVVILDTLSTFLDPATVVPGASSHSYSFERLEGNVLRFTFDNILLPDSTVNEPASHGFVAFEIDQQPGNPIGTLIENNAAIYFDFNDPIITNTVFHMIGEDFVEITVNQEDKTLDNQLQVFPNPSYGPIHFAFSKPIAEAIQIIIYDSKGQRIHFESIRDQTFTLQTKVLSQGWYAYQILTEDGVIWYSGKLIIQ